MRRRTLLLAGAAAGGALFLTGFGQRLVAYLKRAALLRGLDPEILRDLGPEIGGLIALAGDAGASGERLAVLGMDVEPLAARLRATLALQAGVILNLAQARRALVSAIADDFSAGRVIADDGWVLSETEATLARLRWLVAGKGAIKEPSPALDAPVVITQVENWGPKRAIQGVPVNVQRDGRSALWFKTHDAPPWIVLRVDGKGMPTSVRSTAVTTRIRDPQQTLISKPGKHRIEFFDPPTGRVQHVGDFEVLPRPEPFVHADGSTSAVFCALQGWGPQETTVGVVRNPQRDGSMGLWIKTSCVLPDSSVFVGDVRLKTTIAADRVSARVPLALLESPGTHSVYILHFGSNERLPVGEFRVLSSP